VAAFVRPTCAQTLAPAVSVIFAARDRALIEGDPEAPRLSSMRFPRSSPTASSPRCRSRRSAKNR